LVGKFGRFVCGGVDHWCYCTQSWKFPVVLHVSGLERVREIGSSFSGAVRFLLMTFPLTTGYNMFIDPCFLDPSISPSATQFLTAAYGEEGGLYRSAIQGIYRQ